MTVPTMLYRCPRQRYRTGEPTTTPTGVDTAVALPLPRNADAADTAGAVFSAGSSNTANPTTTASATVVPGSATATASVSGSASALITARPPRRQRAGAFRPPLHR